MILAQIHAIISHFYYILEISIWSNLHGFFHSNLILFSIFCWHSLVSIFFAATQWYPHTLVLWCIAYQIHWNSIFHNREFFFRKVTLDYTKWDFVATVRLQFKKKKLQAFSKIKLIIYKWCESSVQLHLKLLQQIMFKIGLGFCSMRPASFSLSSSFPFDHKTCAIEQNRVVDYVSRYFNSTLHVSTFMGENLKVILHHYYSQLFVLCARFKLPK